MDPRKPNERNADLSGLRKLILACIPNQVDIDQLKLVAIKWLKKNPEKLHKKMYFLYWYIIKESFPCEDSK